MNAPGPLRSFGRRKGRKLRPGKQELFDDLLSKLQIGIEELKNWRMEEKHSPFPLWLEIGFGGGEHLAHIAELHPDITMLGCEPYINGIAGLLEHIAEQELSNIRVFTDDARLLIEKLPDASLSRVFILYPDPWPKARHNKRRLVNKELLDMLARVMKPGAELRLATDHADYATWMLERLLAHPVFSWTAKNPEDWLNPPTEWMSTRYEQKGLAGQPTYLNFIKN